MKSQPKENQSTRSSNGKDATMGERSPYSTPILQIHGSVSKLTQKAGSPADGGGSFKSTSDRRTKENIVRIGDHPFGIGLYLFDYKPEYRKENGHGRQFGVMADEVEIVMPGAVSEHPDGYKQVNYSMLGIDRNVH